MEVGLAQGKAGSENACTACSSLIRRQDGNSLYFTITYSIPLPCHPNLRIAQETGRAEAPAGSQRIPHPLTTHLPQPLPSCFPGLKGHLQGWKIPAGPRGGSLLLRGAVDLEAEHQQTFIVVTFPERKNLGRRTDSQLVDPTEAEQPCVCGRQRARGQTLLRCSWGCSHNKTSQAEDFRHFPDIPASTALVGRSRERIGRISLSKGQAAKAGLDSFSPLPARAARPTQETISVSQIPADRGRGGNPLESRKANIWLICTP